MNLQKKQSFATNYLISLNILFQYKTLLMYLVDLMYQLPKCPYSYFS